MVHIKASVLAAFLALVQVNGHFLLNYPMSAGFSDDDEGKAPCGGFDAPYDKITDFFVDSDSISLTSTHPAAIWLFRATLDVTAGGNWTNLLPVVSQDSLGKFCEKSIKVPSDFAGQKGIIQIVQSATDGLLYQCAAVNFKSGSNPTVPSACTNVTGLTAAFTTDAALSTIPAGSVASSSSGSETASSSGSETTSSSTVTGTGSAASPSATGNSASTIEKLSGTVFFGSILALGAFAIGL